MDLGAKRSAARPSTSGETASISKKPKKFDSSDAEFMSNLTTCMTSVTKVLDTSADNDSHALWCKLLSMKLRNLHPHAAEDLKIKIDGMVHEQLKADRE